jgi:hypothetical protein
MFENIKHSHFLTKLLDVEYFSECIQENSSECLVYSGFFRRCIVSSRNKQYFVSKNAECLEQEVNLHIKVISETYEIGYGMPRTSGIRFRLKCRDFDIGCCFCINLCVRVRVCVCVCMCVVFLATLRVCARNFIVSLYDVLEAEALGPN